MEFLISLCIGTRTPVLANLSVYPWMADTSTFSEKLNLQPVKVMETLNRDQFHKDFLKSQQPVVIKQLTKDWPARRTWTFERFKDLAGERKVPLYDDRPVDYKDAFNQPHTEMKLGAYIELLQQERNFLFY